MTAIPFRSSPTRMPVIPLAFLLILTAGCTDERATDSLRASGTVEVTEVRVAARTPGELLRLLVDEGSRVARGDTLAVVNHDMLTLQLAQARANADAAAAQLDLLRQGARAEDIAQARAQLTQAEVQVRLARQDAERIRALSEGGSATGKQLDDVEARLVSAEAGAEAVRQSIRKLEHLVRPEELRASDARLRQAESSIALLERQMADAFIVAPMSGIVTRKMAEAGELVSAGMPIVTLADMDRAFLRIYVPEIELGRIQIGQSADVYSDSYPDRPLPGRITFISPTAEFTPKNVQTRDERIRLVYEVKIEAPNPGGVLKPGMYADAKIALDGAH
jgi:HlyD family secretion protein